MEIRGVMKSFVFFMVIFLSIQILAYAKDCCVYETSVAGSHVHPWLDPPQSTWLAGKHTHTITIQGAGYTTSESGEHAHVPGTDNPSASVPASHAHTIVRNSVLYTTSAYEECNHYGICANYCGDHNHIIEIPTESCSECPSNCQTCTCIESWSCTAWDNCVNSQQSRTCTDSNNCGTTNYKPVIAQSCCSESWTCTEWSSCISNVQTRTCTDSKNCGTTVNKPDMSQSCTLCGNGIVNTGETCTSCPSDVSCGTLKCLNGQCIECATSSDCAGKESLTGEFVCSADNRGVHAKMLETSGDCVSNKCTGSIEKLGPVRSCEGMFCQDGRCGCSEGYSGCEALGKCVKMSALEVNDACSCDFQCKSSYCRNNKCMQGLVANLKSADTVLKPNEETSVSFSISNPFDEEIFADIVVGIGSGSSISGVLGGEYCSGSQCKTTVKLPGNGQEDITIQLQSNDIGTINLQGTVTYTRGGEKYEVSKELTIQVTETGKEEIPTEQVVKQTGTTKGYQCTTQLCESWKEHTTLGLFILISIGIVGLIIYHYLSKNT